MKGSGSLITQGRRLLNAASEILSLIDKENPYQMTTAVESLDMLVGEMSLLVDCPPEDEEDEEDEHVF